MVKISIEIKHIQNGFIVENSYLDGEQKYFETFEDAKEYADVCFNHFEDEELTEPK